METFMQFIGITAAVDAVITLIAYIVVVVRKKRLKAESPMVEQTINLFARYLLLSFGFLLITAISLIILTGEARLWGVFVSDLILWSALFTFILFVTYGKSKILRLVLLLLFALFALGGQLFQVPGLYGGTPPEYGTFVSYILSQMAPLLMYAVWVPSAFYFFYKSSQKNVSKHGRERAIMIGIALLLITFSWAFRLLFDEASILIVIVSSVTGFFLLLMGVLYRQDKALQNNETSLSDSWKAKLTPSPTMKK